MPRAIAQKGVAGLPRLLATSSLCPLPSDRVIILPSNPQDPRPQPPHELIVQVWEGGVSFLSTALQPHHLLLLISAFYISSSILHPPLQKSPLRPTQQYRSIPHRLSSQRQDSLSEVLGHHQKPICRADLGRRGILYSFRECQQLAEQHLLIHLICHHVRDPA